MKKLYAAIFLISLFSNIYAQTNVNVDNYRFNYYERSLPAKPQNPMFFYYTTRIDIPNTLRYFVDEPALYYDFKINGQRWTDNPAKDDVIAIISMGQLTILGSDVKKRSVTNKDKTRTEDFYWLEINYSFQSNLVATKGEIKIANNQLLSERNVITYKSPEFSNRRAASEYWQHNKENLRELFIRDVTSQSVAIASTILTNAFGFPLRQDNDIIKTMNEKKHPENNFLRAKSDELKARLESLDGTTPLRESDLMNVIEYFENIPLRYTDTTNPKGDARLRYVAYYNLCKIYLYLDQPDKVKQYADLITENGYDKKDGDRMNEAAQKLTLRFDISGVETRQFDPDNYFLN